MEGDSTASGHGDCSGVVENENDWGLGDEVLEDLAVDSHAASARSGAGASSHNSSSAARIPSIVQTGGAGSISSCSVIATGNYFDETAWRSRHVISARKVICPKNNVGSKDYVTIVGIMRPPPLLFLNSLARQSITVPRTLMGSSPTNTMTFSLSMLEIWTS
jgi:hypothetical protein